VKEWTPTLPNELPLWELESQWTFESLEGDYRGQNSFDWKVFYIIRKRFERRCLKWACITYLDTKDISYGRKKGRETNGQFDSRPLKVENRPDFLMCRWCATYRWKTFDERYNFNLNLTSIRGLHTKLWTSPQLEVYTQSYEPPKLWESLFQEFQNCHLGVPRQNAIRC